MAWLVALARNFPIHYLWLMIPAESCVQLARTRIRSRFLVSICTQVESGAVAIVGVRCHMHVRKSCMLEAAEGYFGRGGCGTLSPKLLFALQVSVWLDLPRKENILPTTWYAISLFLPPYPPINTCFAEEDEAPVDDVPTSSEGTDIWKVKQIDETSAHWAWRFPLSNLNKEEKVRVYISCVPPKCRAQAKGRQVVRCTNGYLQTVKCKQVEAKVSGLAPLLHIGGY